MKPIHFTLIFLLVVVAIVSSSKTTLWPQPQLFHTTENSGVIAVISQSIFKTITSVNIVNSPTRKQISIGKLKVLQDAVARYSSIVFSHTISLDQATSWAQFIPHVKSTKKVEVNRLVIELNDASTSVAIDADESYSITVPDADSTITISATNQWGALRALETLSQLIVPAVDTSNNQLVNFAIVELPVTIQDFARYKWRGLMIDVARHYLPMSSIKRIIDAMSWEKFNKLHMHLVDAQSFPVQIPKFENISSLSQFGPGKVYTPSQIKEIVAYAYERGIEVIPEFDMPGHAYSWSHAFPEAVSTCKPGTTNINNFPVQPASEKTYEIVDAIAKYAQDTFQASFLHIGSDEVVEACWRQDPTVQAFMNSTFAKTHGINDMVDLYGYFQSRVQESAQKYGRTMIAWEELALDVNTKVYKFPTNNTIIQSWHSENLAKVAALGYHVIHSGGFYLDKQKPSTEDVNRWLWVDTWKDFYESDPNKFINDTEHRKLVIGVEACMWGEQVSELNIEARIWPRVSAVAERGWSSENMTCNDPIFCSTQEPRLINHACSTLVRRGLRSGPIRPDYCPYVDYLDDAISTRQHKLTRNALIASAIFNVVLLIALIIAGTLAVGYYAKLTKSDESRVPFAARY